MVQFTTSPSVRILILCTGNSCRSQMAEGILRSLAPGAEICSAGTHPAHAVHPKAIEVMKEIGIDISAQIPKNVDQFRRLNFDYVITVCNDADENCPAFYGFVQHRLHIGFRDPVKKTGTEAEILEEFRSVRDGIRTRFTEFWNTFVTTLRVANRS